MSTPLPRAISRPFDALRLAARLTAIALLLIVNGLIATSPASACSGPLVPLAAAADGASRIVVGTVVDKTTTRPYELVLTVERVLKGRAPDTLRVSELLHVHQCGDSIDAEPGQRLLIAFDVRRAGQTYNPTLVFDGSGHLVYSWMELPNDHWDLDDVISALSSPSTDMDDAPRRTESREPVGPILVATFAVAFLIGLRRRHGQRRPNSSVDATR